MSAAVHYRPSFNNRRSLFVYPRRECGEISALSRHKERERALPDAGLSVVPGIPWEREISTVDQELSRCDVKRRNSKITGLNQNSDVEMIMFPARHSPRPFLQSRNYDPRNVSAISRRPNTLLRTEVSIMLFISRYIFTFFTLINTQLASQGGWHRGRKFWLFEETVNGIFKAPRKIV